MKKNLAGLFFVALATIAVVPTAARAETTNLSSMLELLQSLMKQVEDLQKQLANLRTDIHAELSDGIKEGVTSEEVRKIQELLATDPTIYPRGIVSGYFGPLTKDAVKTFQRRHGYQESGEVDADTKELMLEYFKEKTNGKIPPGLLRAPGIDKKISERLRLRDGSNYLDCKDKKGSAFLCKDDDNDEEEDDDSSTSTTTSAASVKAQTAITAAEVAISALEDSIDVATSTEAISEAESELSDAKDDLKSAEEDFDDKDFASAYRYASKAKKIAQDALAVLKTI